MCLIEVRITAAHLHLIDALSQRLFLFCGLLLGGKGYTYRQHGRAKNNLFQTNTINYIFYHNSLRVSTIHCDNNIAKLQFFDKICNSRRFKSLVFVYFETLFVYFKSLYKNITNFLLFVIVNNGIHKVHHRLGGSKHFFHFIEPGVALEERI